MKSHQRREQLWLHEATQRWLVRLGVLLLALLPLFATISFVAVSRTGWYQLRQSAYWRERIRNNLGLDVVFSSIEMPSPNRFRIRQLVVAHPETQTPILLSEMVEGVMSNDGWLVELQSATMRQAQSDLALAILHDSFLCRPHNSVPLLKLSIDEVQILPDTTTASSSLEEVKRIESAQRVQIEYSPSLAQSEIKIQFGLTNSPGTAPAIVHVVRNHEASNPRTEWALDTRGASIPCAPFSSYFSALSNLGTMATFRGQVKWSQDLAGWESRIANGTFEHANWENVTSSIGSPLRGRGNLYISDAVISNGNIEHITGSLTGGSSRDESVNLDWLVRSSLAFQWGHDDVGELKNSMANVEELNLGFYLSSEGLQWHGNGTAIPNGQGPSYNVFASVENLRFATRSKNESPVVAITKVGDWLAASQSHAPTQEIATRWHSKLASMLPMPTVGARLSGLPSNSR